MKKTMLVGLFLLLGITLTACGETGVDKPSDNYDESRPTDINEFCGGEGNFVIIEDDCFLITDILSKNITFKDDVYSSVINNDAASFDQMVADLSDSIGLAVVPKTMVEEHNNSNLSTRPEILNLSSDQTEVTDNLLVKLTEDGTFKEVNFTDSNGESLTISANPLVLEVYGPFSIVAFDVSFSGNTEDNRTLRVRLYDSLHSGGIYLIHNETGKVFNASNVELIPVENKIITNHSEQVQLEVTLNEPVLYSRDIYLFDEEENPLYDEEGNHKFETKMVPLLDNSGDPVIYTEGPLKTEMRMANVYDYSYVLVYDDSGDVKLDDEGEPVYELKKEVKLNQAGDEIFELQELPVLDEEGNFVYLETFTVDLEINYETTKYNLEYNINVGLGPLEELAYHFINNIVDEYFNWNFYRVNDYLLDFYSQNFVASETDIFYYNTSYHGEEDTYISRLTFDHETEELLLEQEYINATRLGFENCGLYVDPLNNNIICHRPQRNIQLFSPTIGLTTIPNSDDFNIVVMPNKELYFYKTVSDAPGLDYETLGLFKLTNEGEFISSHMELSEVDNVCSRNSCYGGVDVKIFDDEGTIFDDRNLLVNITYDRNQPILGNAFLQIKALNDIDSTLGSCNLIEGCYRTIYYDLYIDSTHFLEFSNNYNLYPGDDVLPFSKAYSITEDDIKYKTKTVSYPLLCEEEGEFGCPKRIHLGDSRVMGSSLSFYQTFLLEKGDKLINSMNVKQDNNIEYIYEKTFENDVCDKDEGCDKGIEAFIYDLEGNQISKGFSKLYYDKGEQPPLYLNYNMSENTLIEKNEICEGHSTCTNFHQTPEGISFSTQARRGDERYTKIEFSEDDRIEIFKEHRVSEICTNTEYCFGHEVTYNVYNDEGELAFVFQSHLSGHLYERLPYTANLTFDDLHINHETGHKTVNVTCEKDTCTDDWVLLYNEGETGFDSLAQTKVVYNKGDKMIDRIYIPSSTDPFDVSYERLCKQRTGCFGMTRDYTILDKEGNEMNLNKHAVNSLSVKFNYDEPMPSYIDESFKAVFEVIESSVKTINIPTLAVFSNKENIKTLDENRFFVEPNHFANIGNNIILQYNETTNRYRAYETNLPNLENITKLGEGFIANDNDRTLIYYFEYNAELSNENIIIYDITNLTEGKQINSIENITVDYDGTIYFEAVNSFIQDITGIITPEGDVLIDVTYTEREVVRLRPIN